LRANSRLLIARLEEEEWEEEGGRIGDKGGEEGQEEDEEDEMIGSESSEEGEIEEWTVLSWVWVRDGEEEIEEGATEENRESEADVRDEASTLIERGKGKGEEVTGGWLFEVTIEWGSWGEVEEKGEIEVGGKADEGEERRANGEDVTVGRAGEGVMIADSTTLGDGIGEIKLSADEFDDGTRFFVSYREWTNEAIWKKMEGEVEAGARLSSREVEVNDK
jgi:hypothetical protein